MPAEKSLNFGPSAKRLLRRLRPERAQADRGARARPSAASLQRGRARRSSATPPTSSSTASSAEQLPAGITAAAGRRRRPGRGRRRASPTCSSGMTVVPGQGIDFGALARVLMLVLALYVVAVGVQLAAGLRAQRRRAAHHPAGCASDVEDKLHRLPLRYFDSKPRGELLSRVTNDIDNIPQTLQQTLSQLLTSLLTVVGVLVMMLIISPLLALVALVVGPAVDGGDPADRQAVAAACSSRSGRSTGELNAHDRGDLHRARAGQGVRPPAGGGGGVRGATTSCHQASFGAQFMSGIIMPAMMFIGNLNYVAIAVVGGLRVASGQHVARRRAGVHPVLPPVHPAADPGRVDGQPAAVRRRLGGAGLRAARRRGAGARPGSTGAARRDAARPGRVRARVVPLRAGQRR